LEERERLIENKRLVAAAKYAVWMRNYQRARVRALTRLAKAYPDEYKELFEEEKQNDYTQGKLGLTLTATLIALWVLAPGPIPRPAVEIHFEKPKQRNNREDEGDLE
jgi:hypothetical protein